jgi:phage terminase large subunit
MQPKVTKLFSKNLQAFNSGVRRIVNMGGTSSSKTYSELQLFERICDDRRDEGVVITVVSESLPHLKQGAIKDFEIILKNLGAYNPRHINETDKIYSFGNSEIQFTSADIGKATGPRRNILLLNECNNIPYKVVSELEQRTDEVIFYDFNPVAPFWMEEKVLSLPSKEFVLIKSNLYDNDYLPDAIRHEIELKASRDPNYKRIHIDVEYGSAEGLIFPSFTLIDDDKFPVGNNGYGMDFGFTNDPTTLTDVVIIGDDLYCDERLYQTGMTTPDIIRSLRSFNIGRKEIEADSSDPRMIEEIRRAGFNIFPAPKGPGSIEHGIDSMKRYNLHVTKRSVNLIKELRNYKWKEDSSGRVLNEPMDFWNHCIDGIRYRVAKITTKPTIKKAKFNF